MNPAEYNMLWMGQFPPERMVLDENSMLSVGMSVLDDMPHQHHSMVSLHARNESNRLLP